MARPLKIGLDYFPLDSKLEDKVELMEAECGLSGFAILIKLWQKIYSEGYYIKWEYDNMLLFAKKINAGVNEVSEVVNSCLRRDIFNKELYEKYSVLTSSGIQKRFFKICTESRRSNLSIIKEYSLFTPAEIGVNEELIRVNTEFTLDNVDICEETIVNESVPLQKVHKGKESKVKEIKRNERKGKEEGKSHLKDATPFGEIQDIYNDTCISLPKINKLSKQRKNKIRARLKELGNNMIALEAVFKRVEDSNFCTGKNERGWRADFDWIIKNEDTIIKIQEGKYDNTLNSSNSKPSGNMFFEYAAEIEERERREDI
ncbi:MAG: DUF4373 domain-containing protein [Alkaliphilus sp.]